MTNRIRVHAARPGGVSGRTAAIKPEEKSYKFMFLLDFQAVGKLKKSAQSPGWPQRAAVI